MMAPERSCGEGASGIRVQGSVEIHRPLQEVFNYVSDVDNYPKWMAHVMGVRKIRLVHLERTTGSSWPSSP